MKQFVVGMLVLAKYMDGQWYRASVLQVAGNQIEVQFFDYGNTDFVSSDG